ncbi:hypothetical protein GQ53DRAFT_759374 [Thozetella sp. PMI_491]|nr:hypothetical protein GQ53DRAFT_759374 [Thozetella sp. PMI_491]
MTVAALTLCHQGDALGSLGQLACGALTVRLRHLVTGKLVGVTGKITQLLEQIYSGQLSHYITWLQTIPEGSKTDFEDDSTIPYRYSRPYQGGSPKPGYRYKFTILRHINPWANFTVDHTCQCKGFDQHGRNFTLVPSDSPARIPVRQEHPCNNTQGF